MNLSVAFGLIMAGALIGVGINSVRTGLAPGRFGSISRSRWPFRFWLAVVLCIGSGIYVLYQVSTRVV